jgi:hypothetical protein
MRSRQQQLQARELKATRLSGRVRDAPSGVEDLHMRIGQASAVEVTRVVVEVARHMKALTG